MKKLPFFLLLLILSAGCAHHEKPPGKVSPYEQWDRQTQKDEDHDFFYGSWLNPKKRDQDFDRAAGTGIAGPPSSR